MYDRILVPLDRSSFAENALPRAVAIARRTGGTLHLVTVHAAWWPDGAGPGTAGVDPGFDSMLVREEQEYLEALARTLGADHDVAASATLLEGAVAPALARYARDANIDLVVMSTHGHGGVRRAWLGSTADRLLRRLRIPVLLVRPLDSVTPVGPPRDFAHVLVALDGTAAAEQGLEAAGHLPLAPGSRCTLVRVAAVPILPGSSFMPDTARDNHEQLQAGTEEAERYLDSKVPDAAGHWDRVDCHVVAAYRVADAILDRADSVGADLIVVGTHGRAPIGRVVLGSVADKVVRGAAVPVLVYPARAVARTAESAASIGQASAP